MSIVLGTNQYGKAENRVVRITRDTARHEITDLNVSTSLRGDFADAHVTGDQAKVLPTDTQKNTVFSFAKEKGIESPEQFGLALADHFLEASPRAEGARIEVREAAWSRIDVDGQGHGFGPSSGSTSTGRPGIKFAGLAGEASTMNTSRSRLSRLKMTGGVNSGLGLT